MDVYIEHEKEKCILCGRGYLFSDDGNELGFCVECIKQDTFPYDLDAYYDDLDRGIVEFKGFDTMSRGILENYKRKEGDD